MVDEFDAELANVLLGDGDAAHLLREAMYAGLFISPLGGDPSRYRYHQLFRELLHARLAEDSRHAQELHARAGEWYEKTGQYVLAVDQFVRARDLSCAFGILHEHVAHDWFANNPTDSEAWLGHLSDDDVRTHRGRMVDYAIALGLAGKVEEQGRWLALASSQGSDNADGESSFDLRMAAATAHWHGMRGEPEPAIAFERDVVPRMKPGTDFVIDQFPIVSARAHLYNGQPTAAISTCERGLTVADPVSRAVLLGIRGRAMFELGQLHLARQAAEEATDVARKSGIEHHVGLFDALLTMGGLNLEADQLDEAERLIEEATRRSERIRPPFTVMALVERAALLRARGQLVEGLAILEQGRAVLPAGVVSPLYHRADALEAIIRVDMGEPEHALALARALPPRRVGASSKQRRCCPWGRRREPMRHQQVLISPTTTSDWPSSSLSLGQRCSGRGARPITQVYSTSSRSHVSTGSSEQSSTGPAASSAIWSPCWCALPATTTPTRCSPRPNASKHATLPAPLREAPL